jgi:hypothetical protein
MEKGCPYCNESRGEKTITSILVQKRYYFEREVRFDGCKYKYHLRFDFLVGVSDGKWFLIEYHGLQHYESGWWGSSMTQKEGDDVFEVIQKRDQIKKQYANDNGIPLLVIPYWDSHRMEFLVEDFIRGI